ncbi:Uncharacterised protein [Vibrio cholerae]|uniref:Uncharacterized protein n=1 Tax=Vibrio cholerae TaxID=666 RepID=A0A655UY51_VIBCL|nr:Uncharacterised protein [Vibrio cholerae]CSB57403.1 Uncharacterised protein [Vibrio cholerae]CSB82229.1 Uncharacterised protein [Vibrio cholerae]CSC16219.1 Uncharacterised protein [Vibrio cholerae]CSC38436.1 Uncharacterised protein [Vibrio cholerae]
MLVLQSTGLLHIKGLLIIGQLRFEAIDFLFANDRTLFSLHHSFIGFFDHHHLLFEAEIQLFEIFLIAFNFFLLTQRILHQLQVVRRALVILLQRRLLLNQQF